MKRCLQLVALAIASMLAVEPALADILCVGQLTGSMDCCAGMDNASGHGSGGASITAEAGCDGGCCTVAPQPVPLPIVPAKAIGALEPMVQLGATESVAFTPVRQTVPPSFVSSDPLARYLLLQVFRI